MKGFIFLFLSLFIFIHASSSAASCDVFRHNFSQDGNSPSNSGFKVNDGNVNFTYGWKENDPSGNNVKIRNGYLHLERDWGSASTTAHRRANLSAYSNIELSFDYTAVQGHRVFLQYSIDGNTWHAFPPLEVIENTTGGHFSTFLPDYMLVPNFRLKFRLPTTKESGSTNNYVGFGVKFTVDNFELRELCGNGGLWKKTKVSLGTVSSDCKSMTMTITLCSNFNCTNIANNTTEGIVIEVSPIDAPLVVSQGYGQLTVLNNEQYYYWFNSQDNGQVSFLYENSYPGYLNIKTYAYPAYYPYDRVTQRDYVPIPGAMEYQIVGPENLPALKPEEMEVRYSRLDASGQLCGVKENYNGTQQVKMWHQTQAGHQGVVKPEVNGAVLNTSEPSSSNVTLNFINGVAKFDFQSFDVGHYVLALSGEDQNHVDWLAGERYPIVGESAPLVITPFALAMDADYLRRDQGTNADNIASRDEKFVSAGEAFELELLAVGWQAADDLNNDGLPDTGANLLDNSILLGFEQDGTNILNFNLAISNIKPVGGVAGNFTYDPVIFNDGVAAFDAQYSEVGAIDVHASLQYLGASVSGSLKDFGRFTPHQFSITSNTPSFRNGLPGWSCPFTYQGQPLTYNTPPQFIFTPKDRWGNQVFNYVGDYFKYDIPNNIIAANLITGGNSITINSLSQFKVLDAADFDGSFILARQAASNGLQDSFKFNKDNVQPTSLDAPFNADIAIGLSVNQLTDQDGACYSLTGLNCEAYAINNITGANIRYGRIKIDSASGGAAVNLQMPVTLQHYAQIGSSSSYDFVTNAADSCSQFVASSESSSTSQFTNFSLSNFTGSLVAGDTAPSVTSINAGQGFITMSAPGAGKSGKVKVSSKSLDWLKADYDSATAGLEPASAWATFGATHTLQPVLYRFESYRN